MVNLLAKVKNRTPGPTFSGIDSTNVSVFVDSFSESDVLPSPFRANRVIVEALKLVRSYGPDGESYTESKYVDQKFVDDNFLSAVNPVEDKIQWIYDIGNYGYGGSSKTITYYGVGIGIVNVPDTAGDIVGIHRATGTNEMFIGLSEDMLIFNGVDVDGLSSVFVSLENQTLLLGKSGQSISYGNVEWSRQGASVSDGDGNSSNPQYRDIEGSTVGSYDQARHATYSPGGGRVLEGGAAARGYMYVLELPDGSMNEDTGDMLPPGDIQDQVEFIPDDSSPFFWFKATAGGGFFDGLRLFRVFSKSIDSDGAEDEFIRINPSPADALGAKIDKNTADIKEGPDLSGVEADIASNASAIAQNSSRITSNILDTQGNTADLTIAMKRTPNTGSVDSEKEWQAEERRIKDCAGIKLSTHGNSFNGADIQVQNGPTYIRWFDGTTGGLQFKTGRAFDFWKSGQVCTIDEDGIDLYGGTFRNVTGIQHDGLHDIVLNHGKGLRLAGPDDTGHGFRMFNDADNGTRMQRQKSDGSWFNFLKIKSGSYGDAELCPDTLSLLGMPHFVTHRQGSSVIFANADNETGTTKDGVIYWENKTDSIQLSGVTKEPGTNQYSEKHLAIKVEKTGDVEIPELKATKSMYDVAASQSLRQHFATLSEHGTGSSSWANA